jgi:hypothetical protein
MGKKDRSSPRDIVGDLICAREPDRCGDTASAFSCGSTGNTLTKSGQLGRTSIQGNSK